MYDVLIVGGGPAGCSAALTLRLRGKSVLMAFSDGGALAKAARIDNYPGMPRISGPEMLSVLRNQCREAGVEIKETLVQRILPMGKSFTAMLGNEICECKSVLIATGAGRVALLQGEEALVGMGVSYCATCDGMFYKGRSIAVIGAWEEAVEEANFLAGIAGSVTYFSEKKHDLSRLSEKIAVSEKKPLSLASENGQILLDGEAFDGVFILRPAMALSQLMPELEREDGRILSYDGFFTSVKNVFVAGDALGAPYQIAKAVGDGNMAALAIAKALDNDAKE